MALVVCHRCGAEFEARRTAKWCSEKCRKAKGRETVGEVGSTDPVTEVDGLVESVRRDLVTAGRLNTTAGQLALELARDLRSSTSKAPLSRELRLVLAEALADDGESDPKPSGEELELANEIEAARLKREAKIRKAAGQA